MWFSTVITLLSVTLGANAFSKGFDLSSTAAMEQAERVTWYNTNGQKQSIEAILGANGMDSIRLRLWTGSQYGVNYVLPLAQRFSKQGYKIFLDFHLSSTWADPAHQLTPSGWSTTSISSLSTSVRNHVSSTLKAFHAGGVDLSMISLGNEIRSGMLFPLGKINNDDFNNVATLWAAARAGVNDATSAGVKKPQVMVHLDNGWDQGTMTWWFKGFFGTGKVKTSDVDALGFSFYPFFGSGATTSNLQKSLNTLASTYKKPLYVVETNWPTACSGKTMSANFPLTTAGQKQWVQSVVKTVQAVPNGLGAGVYYFEPGFVNNTALGSACESATLFQADWKTWPNTKATAMTSVNMFV
ncbi:family 53 glycosyl hydrolase [Elsinoe ampelina]|uniref:Arabinogalactan endo-beta-1,4-galactanase n=1 Tax=Elsinoe ampelina TaxID=302913 RepID=A0A6A6FYP8_9PEZI|nr:family 53 glycosyl hydrolase [Elsinoe ampelina]